MKLSELTIGKEYAVVPSWTYRQKSARDVATVQESEVVKATLVSLDKYDYQPSSRRSNPAEFSLAQAGERSVGVLVKAVDSQGSDVFWTSRLADIIAEWSALEPRWANAKLEQERREREEQERRDRIHRLQEEARNEVERSRNSILESAKELLGANDVKVDTEGYGEEVKGVVTFSIKEFERLIELAYAGKEN